MIIAGGLLPTIKGLCISYIEQIGSTDEDQNDVLFTYLNHALRRLASIAYQQKDSDLLALSADGYVTFNKGTPITNMYAPLRILDPDGQPILKRVSYADTKGWWRESSNSTIHIKGFTNPQPLVAGNYMLQYIAYPAAITSVDSVVEFPEAGSMGLCYTCAALIMESLDDSKDLAMHYYTLADSHNEVVLQANIEGRGTSSGGYVPSMANAAFFRNRK